MAVPKQSLRFNSTPNNLAADAAIVGTMNLDYDTRPRSATSVIVNRPLEFNNYDLGGDTGGGCCGGICECLESICNCLGELMKCCCACDLNGVMWEYHDPFRVVNMKKS